MCGTRQDNRGHGRWMVEDGKTYHSSRKIQYMFQTFFVEERTMIVLELVVVYFFNQVVYCCNELSLIFV